MRKRVRNILFPLALGIFHHAASSMEVVADCQLGKDGRHRVQLTRDHRIGSTAIYYLSQGGNAPQRIYEGEENQSRGDSVKAVCAGTQERVLVISGEFSSNYLQGVALRYNTRAQKTERIDFAERYRPLAVYLSSAAMLVLIPNTGRNESPKRYIIYGYVSGEAGTSGRTYSDRLPGPAFKRIAVN